MNAVYTRIVRTATIYGADFRPEFSPWLIGILPEDLETTWKRMRAAVAELAS
jgi:hypothetical protein